MLLKIGLLVWFIAFVLSLIAKAESRIWIARLFIGGFCLLLLAAFLKVISRVV